MKFLIAASFALALGAVLLSLFLYAAPSTARVASADGGDALDLVGLRHDLAALQETASRLSERIVALEMRSTNQVVPAGRAPVVAAQSREDLEPLRELAAAMQDPNRSPTDGFESLVLQVLETKEERERAEAQDSRRQAMAERLDERMAELSEELWLTKEQTTDVHRILTHEALRRQEMFTGVRAGGGFDRGAMREGMAEIRTESLTDLEGVLVPDQYERYVELEGRNRFGGFTGFGAPGEPGARPIGGRRGD